MTTEGDLDARLAAAAGIHDGDLPSLPQAFVDHLHASDAADIAPPAASTRTAPRPTGTEPASVMAARQLVDDTHTRPRPRGRRGRRPPGRHRRQPRPATRRAHPAPAASVNLLLADYSTTPTTASEQRLTEIRATCAWAIAVSVGAAGDHSPGAITEARDAWGWTSSTASAIWACLTRRTGPHDDTVQSVAAKPAVTTAVATGISTDAVTYAELTGPHQLGYTAAVGRSAPDVTGVDVRLANGQMIAATVRDGWWAAWWPNDNSPGVQATQLACTPRDGRISPGGGDRTEVR